MNNKILNLDNKITLKKTVENNIIYVIKNYSIIINEKKIPFNLYIKEYLITILYNNVKILLIIEEKCDPLTMNNSISDIRNVPCDYKLVNIIKFLWKNKIRACGWNQPTEHGNSPTGQDSGFITEKK